MTTFRSRARRAACDREFRLTRAHHQNSTTSEDANILASELDGHCPDGLGYGQGLRTLRSDVLERPRRRRRQAPSRPVQPTGALAQDQEPGLFAGGRSDRSVQPAAADGTMKYTGPPATLGSSAAALVRLIVWCRDCQHQVEPDPAEQVALYGADLPVRDWVARLVCSQCGSRSIDFVLTGAGP